MPKGSAADHPHDPAQPPRTADSRVATLEKQEGLARLCELIRGERRFAFDTEFVMEDRYEAEVCLVQVAVAGEVALIDPLLPVDLRPLWELVADASVETVVHAGQEDLALCVQHTGMLPSNVFDVQIAAGFVGYEFPLSLQKLIQSLLRVRLHKSKTLTDWRRRPLTEAQLRYAAEDVSYLLPARDQIGKHLARRGRTDWAVEECRRFEDHALYVRVEEEKLRRLKGTAAMTARQLASVRALMHWREGLAKQLDRPARAVLKDHLLVEIAKFGLTSPAEIRSLRGVNLSDKNIRLLGRVVEEAAAIPPEQWPEPAPRELESPREEAIINLATAILRGYCLDMGLAYGLVATKKMIRELIRHRGATPTGGGEQIDLLMGWRARTVGALLDDVLGGRRSVHVGRADGELVVRLA